MVRRAPNSSTERNPKLFSEVEDPALVSKQFWAQLLKYRPLFLLGTLWFALICMSAVAYSRLMFAGVPINSERVDSTATLSQKPSVPQQATISRSEATIPPAGAPLPTDEGADAAADASHAASEETADWVPVWGIVSLVSLCALGSFIISQQAKTPPRPARPRRKRLVKTAQPPKPATAATDSVKRLSPYSPERDNVVVRGGGPAVTEALFEASQPAAPGSQTIGQSQDLAEVPPAAVPQTAVSPRRRQQRPPVELPPKLGNSQRIPKRAVTADAASAVSPGGSAPDQAASPIDHPQTTVVPATEAHPLDWSEVSLAHTLDVRQRRSLSSFM